MGVFEQYPILLVVLIIGVTEAWAAVKALLRRHYGRRTR